MGAVSHAIGNVTGRNANKKARAAKNSADKYYKEQLSGIETSATPFINSGTNALTGMSGMLNPGAGLNTSGMPAEYAFRKKGAPAAYVPGTFSFSKSDPSYQWRLQQGIDAAKADAAASGMFGSGNMYSGLMDLGQNMASQEYANEYNRYLNNEQLKMNASNQAYNQWAQTENLGLDAQKQAFNEWAAAQGLDEATKNEMWNRYYQTAALGANQANALGGFKTGTASNVANNLNNYAQQYANNIQQGFNNVGKIASGVASGAGYVAENGGIGGMTKALFV